MKIIITSFALAYATSTASANSSMCSNPSTAYPDDIPWVEYQGDSYIFTRQKYNSVCVGSNGQQFEYGTIVGVYPSIDAPGGGCSTACVIGVSSDQARGCNNRPPSNRLVGFEYDCEQATCKCLYQAGTLGNQYSQCFADMNTNNGGNGQVLTTQPQQGETCYSLYIQSNKPIPSPTPPVGRGICALEPDYSCYIDGHPPCCNVDGGRSCPNYLTMCNNHAGGESGFDYCDNSPSYTCFDTPNGRPSCCNEPGGSYMNCPQTQPKCDVQPAPKPGPKDGPPPPKTGFESFNVVPTKGRKGTQKRTIKGFFPHPDTGFESFNVVQTKGRKGVRPSSKLTIKGFSPHPDTEIVKLDRLQTLKGQQVKRKANYFRSN